MAKVKIPSLEEIKEKEMELEKALIQKNIDEKNGTSNPKKVFLKNISKHIKKAMEDGTSFVGIRNTIKDIYQIDISTQIISDFAKKELGITRSSKIKNKDIIGKLLQEKKEKELNKNINSIQE